MFSDYFYDLITNIRNHMKSSLMTLSDKVNAQLFHNQSDCRHYCLSLPTQKASPEI